MIRTSAANFQRGGCFQGMACSSFDVFHHFQGFHNVFNGVNERNMLTAFLPLVILSCSNQGDAVLSLSAFNSDTAGRGRIAQVPVECRRETGGSDMVLDLPPLPFHSKLIWHTESRPYRMNVQSWAFRRRICEFGQAAGKHPAQRAVSWASAFPRREGFPHCLELVKHKSLFLSSLNSEMATSAGCTP